MHTNMYAVYACGCSLSVTCQVAMVNTCTWLQWLFMTFLRFLASLLMKRKAYNCIENLCGVCERKPYIVNMQNMSLWSVLYH